MQEDRERLSRRCKRHTGLDFTGWLCYSYGMFMGGFLFSFLDLLF